MSHPRSRVRFKLGPPLGSYRYYIQWPPEWGNYISGDSGLIPHPDTLRGFETHECSDQTHKKSRGGKYTEGGPLLIIHEYRRVNPIVLNISCGAPIAHMTTGSFVPIFMGVPSGYCTSREGAILSSSELDALGTTGWARYRPGRPKVSLTTSLVELRDLPRMLQTRLNDFRGYRGTGRAYLEWKFGWEALLRDLADMYKLFRTIDANIDAVIRHNGKWSNRRGLVSSDVVSEPYGNVGTGFYALRPEPSDLLYERWAQSQVAGIARRERTVWFEGRFRYFIPEKILNSAQWRRSTIRKMYGLTLTPNEAWNLIPWSWLVDYFTNVGDIMEKVANNGYVDAVAKYAYVMATTKHTVSQRSSFVDNGGMTHAATIESEVTIKQRQAATPFGFGMSASLTDAQAMILAALGISKLRM